MSLILKTILLGFGAVLFIHSYLKSNDKPQRLKTKTKVNTMNSSNEENFYLFFRRREREPIRESFYRTYMFIVKDNTLYSKTYAYGRFSQDFTECFKLSPGQMQQLIKGLQDASVNKNVVLNEKEDHSNEQLSYKIKLESDKGKYEQKMDAPGNYYSEHNPALRELWRLLANFSPQEKYPTPEQIKATPALALDLKIRQIFPSKDTEYKTRHYELNGDQLTVTHTRSGRFRDKKEQTLTLTSFQLFKLHQLIEQEKKHLQGYIDTKTVFRHTLFNHPNYECKLEVSYDAAKISAGVRATQYEALEIPTFIVLQFLEVLMDEKSEIYEAFKEDLRSKKRAAAKEKYGKS